MKLSEKQREFAMMVSYFLDWIIASPVYEVTFGEVYRTEYQQKYYVRTGRSKTYKSKHLQRLAIDLNLFLNGKYTSDKEDYRILGEYWEKLGGRWGGRFGVHPRNYKTQVGWDAGHFEYKD